MNSVFKCSATADSFSVYSRAPHNCPYCRCQFSCLGSHPFQATAPEFMDHMGITFNPTLSHFNYTTPNMRTRPSLNKTINFFYGSPNTRKPRSLEAKFSTKKYKKSHFPHISNQVEEELVLQIVKSKPLNKLKRIQNGQKTPPKQQLLKLNRVKSKGRLDIDSRPSKIGSQSNSQLHQSSAEFKGTITQKNSPIKYFNFEATPGHDQNTKNINNPKKSNDSDDLLNKEKEDNSIEQKQEQVLRSIKAQNVCSQSTKKDTIIGQIPKESVEIRESIRNVTFAKISQKMQENTQKSIKLQNVLNQSLQKKNILPSSICKEETTQPIVVINFSERINTNVAKQINQPKAGQVGNLQINNKYPTVKSIQVYEQPKMQIKEVKKQTSSRKGSQTSLKIELQQQNMEEWRKNMQLYQSDRQFATLLSEQLSLNYDYFIANQDTDRSLSTHVQL